MIFKPFWKLLAIIAGVMLVGNCYYDNEEDLYPDNACNTDNVSYTQDVLPILQNNCYSCHNQQVRNGNVTLEGYDNVKIRANSGALVGVIKHQSGFSAMPQGQPQLDGCLIDKIEQWVLDGAKNN